MSEPEHASIFPPSLFTRGNLMPNKRLWSINGRFLAQPMTGVQRYGHEILHALDRHLSGGHPLGDGLDLELLIPPDVTEPPSLDAISVRRMGTGSGHAWEQVHLMKAATGGLLSFCNTGPLLHRKQIVCIHDMNTRIVPESYSLAFRSLYRLLIPALGRSARTVATVSHFSASQLGKFGVRPARDVRVIPDGHEHALRWRPRHSAVTKLAASPDTIVLIGSRAPHKNVAMLLGLGRELAKAGLKLAIVGMADQRVFSGSAALPESSDVLWLGRISDDELAGLLEKCLCLAFPSLTEGFGLPPLEAMALGCPVVVSDRGSLPEICGDAALYASPVNPSQWLEHFLTLRSNQAAREALVARGRARACAYCWPASAAHYLEAMARIDRLVVPRAVREPADASDAVAL